MPLPSASEIHYELERLKAQVQSLRLRVAELEDSFEELQREQARLLADSLPTVPYNEVPTPDEP
jgi:prefoldin subunit 5